MASRRDSPAAGRPHQDLRPRGPFQPLLLSPRAATLSTKGSSAAPQQSSQKTKPTARKEPGYPGVNRGVTGSWTSNLFIYPRSHFKKLKEKKKTETQTEKPIPGSCREASDKKSSVSHRQAPPQGQHRGLTGVPRTLRCHNTLLCSPKRVTSRNALEMVSDQAGAQCSWC